MGPQVGKALTEAEAVIALRAEAILASSARGEAIPGISLFALLLAAHTLLPLATSHAATTAHAVVDIAQVMVLAVSVFLLQRRHIPDRWVSALIMFAIVVGVVGQTFNYTIDGERWVILIVVSMSGTVVLEWAPFWIGVVVMWTVPSLAYLRYDEVSAGTWILGTLVAIGAAANALRSRRRTATELARAEIAIEQLATMDPMTGLLNRRGLAIQSHQVRGSARRTQQPLFAVFIDVGGLKRMNDTHGHAAGDALIVAVAGAVQRIARETDLACRWGGDEFLIVGVGSRPDPEGINRRLLAALDSSQLPAGWDPRLWTGTAQSLDAAEELDSVILRADQDLYVNRQSRHPSER